MGLDSHDRNPLTSVVDYWTLDGRSIHKVSDSVDLGG